MRYETKRNIVWAMHLFTWPLAVPSKLVYRTWQSESVFEFSAKILSLIPSKLGQYLRASFYAQTLAEFTYDVSVGFCSFFAHPTARVGRGVTIGSFTILGTVVIEDNVIIASRVSVLSGKYLHGGGPHDEAGFSRNPIRFETVRIGTGTWLGEGCIVMADVGAHCVVSAGSVTTKAVPAGFMAIGNPARFMKQFKPEEQDNA